MKCCKKWEKLLKLAQNLERSSKKIYKSWWKIVKVGKSSISVDKN